MILGRKGLCVILTSPRNSSCNITCQQWLLTGILHRLKFKCTATAFLLYNVHDKHLHCNKYPNMWDEKGNCILGHNPFLCLSPDFPHLCRNPAISCSMCPCLQPGTELNPGRTERLVGGEEARWGVSTNRRGGLGRWRAGVRVRRGGLWAQRSVLVRRHGWKNTVTSANNRRLMRRWCGVKETQTAGRVWWQLAVRL